MAEVDGTVERGGPALELSDDALSSNLDTNHVSPQQGLETEVQPGEALHDTLISPKTVVPPVNSNAGRADDDDRPNGTNSSGNHNGSDFRSSPASRERSNSRSTVGTTSTQKPSTRSSLVFVVTALETIAASKDARKRKQLSDATAQALNAIKGDADPASTNPEVLFEPLQLATEANTVSVVTTALDCIGKLISYSYFSVPAETSEPSKAPPLIERAIDTICDCFQGEATPVEVQLQILKSLLAAILNDKIIVHGAGLLKAVRQTYNIFLLSKSSANQQVAQGTLTQMVGTVFERVKQRLIMKEARTNLSKVSLGKGDLGKRDEDSRNGNVHPEIDEVETIEEMSSEGGPLDRAPALPNDVPVDVRAQPKITLQSFEQRKSFDDDRIHDSAPTMITRVKPTVSGSRSASGQNAQSIVYQDDSDRMEEDDEDEIFIKDAFLVFRAMCKLSTKPIPAEQAVDLRSQGMRSKLLSLHIIHIILHNNISIFVSPLATIRSSSNNEPTAFVQAIKQYLCLSLSRNGSSSTSRVFEVSCEIFWILLKHLRVMLKVEIEVILKEVYLAILDRKTAPLFQKQYLLTIFGRLASDPRALVEIYLNYDCDRTALDNHFQRIVEHLSRISSAPVSVTAVQEQAYQGQRAKLAATASDWQERGTLPPSLSTATIGVNNESEQGFPPEHSMRQESLEALVEILRSLIGWAQQNIANSNSMLREGESRTSLEESRKSFDTRESRANRTPNGTGPDTPVAPGTPVPSDDPSELEKAKQRKTALNSAIAQFNFKPKRGIKALLQEGFIQSDAPRDIAEFLLSNNRIDKRALGEYLGEGDADNVAIMHAFVDFMDFTKTRFVDALRRFLQSFRLPGEAQKIDRFMLKFAERYVSGNPNAFANADTAYVLAYSVIMLNTDQHSTKLKGRRMTPEDFIKNNRGINDNADLPDEYLRGIYDEIAHNEIVLDTERETAANLGALPQPSGGLAANIGQAFATVGRDLQREAYVQASEEMANKTEQLFKSLLRAQRRSMVKTAASKFIPATSFKHVGPMFEVTWMAFLTAISAQVQDTNNLETIKLCMEGQRLAIRIACMFDLANPRQAFVATLARLTNLYNLNEMKAKNVEALRSLLEIGHTEGNLLKESWRDILTCISQLDRFQLISTGVDEGVVPDVLKVHGQARMPSRKSVHAPAKPRQRHPSGMALYQIDVAEESRSADMIRSVDRIFTNTATLSGDAIVHFVKALTQVSWQEIQSSGQSDSPRTYSLQKIVEISGYNMTRVRFEWTNIWQILGEHFIQVGCHNNTSVVFFALNSLRQLSMRFMEIEELPGFKFQKDFLKPFEHIISNTSVVTVKDMVLRCLIQMIQARGENIRSGWRTMFGVFTVAAREPYESIVAMAFDNVSQIYNTRFGIVISQAAFADLIVCLTEFSKNIKFQKKSLQAIELLNSSVSKMLRTPECPLSARMGMLKDTEQPSPLKQPTRQTEEEQFWFPVLFAFHDVLMTGEDLEVRSRALNYLFDTLVKYGGDFPRDFWDTLWRQLLYPIFMVLKSKSEMSKVLNHEDLSVWLSTTMIQALRNMISLFTHFFDSLEYMLDRFLELLALCICQENDTLARIGSNCLQQLILQNVNKFQPEHWNKIVGAFVDLFARTEATALFAASTSSSYPPSSSTNGFKQSDGTPVEASTGTGLALNERPGIDGQGAPSSENALGINGLETAQKGAAAADIRDPSSGATEIESPSEDKHKAEQLEDYRPDSALQQAPVVVTTARRRYFNQIIIKCVLQLLMIETVNELFSNDAVYAQIPSPELLRLMAVLKKSYHFAKRFNGDRELRTRLFKEGFMKQPPNLLQQESGSAAVYVSILFRMYHDRGAERAANRVQTEQALIPLCVDIIRSYIDMDEETQQRNINTWRPVVVDVLDGYTGFPEPDFERHVQTFAPLAAGLLGRQMGPELQRAVQALVSRIFEVKLGIPQEALPPATPISPRGSVSGPRKTSRGR